MSESKKNHVAALFLVAYCFLLGIFCCGTSPLIDFMSVDSSVFFTIGRGMREGLVAYKDMFEHKGFYLYVFNWIGALISSETSIGLYIVECAILAIGAMVLYKIYSLSVEPFILRILAVLLMLGVSVNYFTFQGGNLVETYGVCLQYISLYFVFLEWTSGEVEHPPRYMMYHGICVAVSLGLRANLVLMWAGIAFGVGFRLLYHKKYRNLRDNIGMGVAGLALGITPMIVYGVMTDSLREMYEQMFAFNFRYSDTSILEKIAKVMRSPIGGGMILISFGILAVFFWKSNSVWEKIEYSLITLFAIAATCISGRTYGHYFEYLVPLLIPAIGWLVSWKRKIRLDKKWKMAVVAGILFTGSIVGNLRFPIKLFADSLSKEYVRVIYECRDELETRGLLHEDMRIIVTDINAMCYNKLNVIPKDKYFYIPSISYESFPNAVDEQANQIINEKNDAVFLYYKNMEAGRIFSTSKYDEQIKEVLKENYEKVIENPSVGMEMYVWRNSAQK